MPRDSVLALRNGLVALRMNQSDLLSEGPGRRENHYLLGLWEGNAFE